MTSLPGARLTLAVTRFCRALRDAGIATTPAETIDAVRALALVDVTDRDEVFMALRAVLVTRPEDYETFAALFDAFWRAPRSGEARRGPPRPAVRPPGERAPEIVAATLQRWARVADDSGAPPAALPAPSAHEVLATREVSGFGDAELRAIERVVARMARRLAMRPSRRWRPASRGARLSLRRTLRQGIATGGVPLDLAFRRRKVRRTSLVVLCDVSGSMELYARFLLQVLYAMQHAFARVETFAFATRLSHITEPLGAPHYARALERVAATVRDWSGGTRIGECVAAFEAHWRRLVDRRTVVVILSDGWDTGDPEVLGRALARLHERAGRVVWLNPLLGAPGYQPLTRGMQAALPHVDVFRPVHDLASLEALLPHLSL
ncbi:MAG: VWA domain-containing protein [Gemmatimonadaceae bacterium]|nr:VWA domain-containing protein [Gemmatimonadaceae bacterium]